MKPFEVGKTYKTRDGLHNVRIVGIRRGNTDYPLVGFVSKDAGSKVDESVETYTFAGRTHAGRSTRYNMDIVPETEYNWVNVYHTGAAGAHATRAIADEHAEPGRIGCRKIAIAPGFDDEEQRTAHGTCVVDTDGQSY